VFILENGAVANSLFLTSATREDSGDLEEDTTAEDKDKDDILRRQQHLNVIASDNI
jgi:hypothetical protein